MGFSRDDRAIIETLFAIEQFQWALTNITGHGSWSRQMCKICDELGDMASEMNDYLGTLEDMDE